jgi:hypothetical protein
VQYSGRPRLWTQIKSQVDAILYAYLPCFSGGDGVASVLFGDHNPSGRLPFPYPSTGEQQRLEIQQKPEWLPFGFGLSYTNFQVGNVTSAPLKFDFGIPDARLVVEAQVSNVGKLPGDTTIFLRIQEPLNPENTTSWKALKRFERLSQLQQGETRSIRFVLFAEELRFLRPQVGASTSTIIEIGDQKLVINFVATVDSPVINRIAHNNLSFISSVEAAPIAAPISQEPVNGPPSPINPPEMSLPPASDAPATGPISPEPIMPPYSARSPSPSDSNGLFTLCKEISFSLALGLLLLSVGLVP